MLRGIDISNLQGPPSAYRDLAWYRNAEFVVVQAIEPPRGYRGWDHIDEVTGRRGYTGEQLMAARDDGKKVGVYAWLWNTLEMPRSDILARLNIVPAGFPLNMRPWVDVEDTTPLGVAPRRAAVATARVAADDWAAERGLPRSGGYSGDWYIKGYLDRWWPSDWPYWCADYGSVAGSRLAEPWRPVHQFTSTPVDMDVMLESEIVEDDMALPPVDERYKKNGWNDWRAVAINLQGIADAMGSEIEHLRANQSADVAKLRARLGDIAKLASL